MDYKNYKFKPGELFMKHQEKMKKKHEKHEKHKKVSVGDQPSMANWNPTPAKIKGTGNNSHAVGGSELLGSPKASTRMMAKRKHSKNKKSFNTTTKKTGKFEGKSNALGHGGRAAQLKARGVPGGVIGAMARAAHAAPGQANYHGKHKKVMKNDHDADDKKMKHEKHHKMGKHCKTCAC